MKKTTRKYATIFSAVLISLIAFEIPEIIKPTAKSQARERALFQTDLHTSV